MIKAGLVVMLVAFASGCASTTPCVTGSAISINPTAATPTHGQTAPANQQKFSVFASQTVVSGSCPVSTAIATIDATWTTSDPVNTQVDSTAGTGTNGLATCLGATTVPAILTATVGNGSSTKTATASLTCK